jgi:hypothetical protein
MTLIHRLSSASHAVAAEKLARAEIQETAQIEIRATVALGWGSASDQAVRAVPSPG